MNASHAAKTTFSEHISMSQGLSLLRRFSWARFGLLALPLAGALGCVAQDGSVDSGDDDETAIEDSSPRVQPKAFLPLRGARSVAAPSVLEQQQHEQAPSQDSGLASTGTVSTGHGIAYHNGSVMSGEVKIYYIFYGTWSSADTTILGNFANDFGSSPNYNINTLYADSSGGIVLADAVLGGTATDNYSQGTTLSDSAVFNVVKTAISGGKLPLDSKGVYFVLTSSDVKESSGFCTSYCGWHTYGTYNSTTLKYSFVGNPATQCPSSCSEQTGKSPNGSIGADAMVSVIAHELEETTSDPLLNAWYDSSGNEDADKCAWTFGTTFSASNGSTANMILNGHEYLVQQNWLNSGSGSCAQTYGQLGAHGGSGGSVFDTACDTGDVAVGVVGRSGSLIDNIGLICASVNSDGSLGSTYTTTQHGGTGGTAFTKQCASGQAMVGIEGRSGSDVDQLTIKCSSISNWQSSGSVQSTVFVGGGSGGNAFDESCNKGYVINRITGRSGSLVDQAQAGCSLVW
jgi:hypothetical protein